MFFIAGTGRCGTKTIAQLVDQSPSCKCVHELKPPLIREAVEHLYGDISDEVLSQLLLATRPQTVNGKTFGESNHRLSLIIPVLQSIYPDAKFVWLIRDGRDTVASMYADSWYRGRPYNILGRVNRWSTWSLRADYLNLMTGQEWRSLLRFERCCWRWAYVNERIESSLANNGCDWIQIRLEELPDQVDTLFNFLALERPLKLDVPRVNRSRDRTGLTPSRWHQWNSQQIGQFLQYCADSMDKWYPTWREDLNEAWSDAGLSQWGSIELGLKRQGQILWGPYSKYAVLRDKYERSIRDWAAKNVPKNVRTNLRVMLGQKRSRIS